VISKIQKEFRERVVLVHMILTLPRAAESGRKMTGDLRSARQEWRRDCQRRGERENISG
jgi:hypothetical protein